MAVDGVDFKEVKREDLTPDQQKTWDLQQTLMKQQGDSSRMTLLFQHQMQQQKERFDSLSNILKSGSDARANMINNSK